jgi:hypothetical protein
MSRLAFLILFIACTLSLATRANSPSHKPSEQQLANQALFMAAGSGHTDLLEFSLDNGAQANARDEQHG